MGRRRELPPGRHDGFAAIEDYAALGDGRTIALLASDGRVDWWPLPTLDAPPAFAALLDEEHGGHFALQPREQFQTRRRYLPETNVLEMVFTTQSGSARVTAALNTGSAGRLPWTELAFRVEGVSGEVALRWELAPGDRFGRVSPWMTLRAGIPVASIGDQSVAVVIGPAAPRLTVEAARAHGELTVADGERVVIGLVATDREPLFVPEVNAIDRRIDRSTQSWRDWSALLRGPDVSRPAVVRSALALKTLLAEASGAIAAAGTTSLPEAIGGPKNWDYRYAWIRDSSFVLDALLNLALYEEVHGAMSWLVNAIRRNGPQLAVFYTLGGSLSEDCGELGVQGYRGSRPVREGNGAARQKQLGTYGDLFDTIDRCVRAGHILDPDTGQLLETLANQCCDEWRGVDSGIWELERHEHYTISKIGCWVALDRAARLAAEGHLRGDVDRWQYEAQGIRSFVEQRCWSEAKQSYSFYADSDRLDAAVLLAGRTGFDRGPRLSKTIDAISAELQSGPYLYRYSGAAEEEGAFVACTYWMVDALAYCGRGAEARQLMGAAEVLANDLGLLSEQADPLTGAALGNVPQALSHLALINAAKTLEEMGGESR